MLGLTAILHTHNDALRIARAVESLRPCDEVLVIDHASADETCWVARAFGARVILASEDAARNYLREALHDWILCLSPTESISEGLEASLLEWKLRGDPSEISAETAFAVQILEETEAGWVTHLPEARLGHRVRAAWTNGMPVAGEKTPVLVGHVLRLRTP